ncbi:hypothetical protein DWB77_01116 [Streptomyces hundungensis]|uniref:Uncharacterized protein n=1 Tax=Streptomyces hundungensis TaxID=1077946 RepID=A0A387HE80_9ACTN|nr:hypothetical protein DWB77_01116 [Streptomyces hundungensis]
MTWTKRRPTTARAAIAVRAVACAAAVATCGLLLAACSSSATPATQAKPAASAAPGTDAYRQCLAQHGVTMAPRPSGSGRPRGSGRPGGFGAGASADPAQREAAQACAGVRPRFGGDGSALKAFTGCLKDHGVVLPSPSPGGGVLRGLNTADPKSARAFQTCNPLLPTHHPATPSPLAPTP